MLSKNIFTSGGILWLCGMRFRICLSFELAEIEVGVPVFEGGDAVVEDNRSPEEELETEVDGMGGVAPMVRRTGESRFNRESFN